MSGLVGEKARLRRLGAAGAPGLGPRRGRREEARGNTVAGGPAHGGSGAELERRYKTRLSRTTVCSRFLFTQLIPPTTPRPAQHGRLLFFLGRGDSAGGSCVRRRSGFKLQGAVRGRLGRLGGRVQEGQSFGVSCHAAEWRAQSLTLTVLLPPPSRSATLTLEEKLNVTVSNPGSIPRVGFPVSPDFGLQRPSAIASPS